jgi:glycosyltransferase involved in cell wall biosynthesis
MISVIILTKNEQQDLPFCLDSLSWCSDIHVLDSGSTDRTQEIALSCPESYNAA